MKRISLSVLLLIISLNMLKAQVLNENSQKMTFDIQQLFSFAENRYKKAVNSLDPADGMPRNAHADGSWNQVGIKDWTSGFFPGILWQLYENNPSDFWLKQAQKWTKPVAPVQYYDGTHDLGFMIFSSFGNGYKLTGDSLYKPVILQAAKTLATRYRPVAKTLQSWGNIHKEGATRFPVIIDNMMNLQLLMWASKNGGSKKLAEIANHHAQTTMKNHFREDWSSYHVVEYSLKTEKPVDKHTAQGYSDESMWARGQSWALYGFTMMYRETGKEKYLNTAKKVAERYMTRLPDDGIPYWDFDAPDIPDAPKDASAAAIASSALLELYHETNNQHYYNQAVRSLNKLASDAYLARKKNYERLLLHSVGSLPNNSEVDVSLNYADYYFLEALNRLRKIRTNSFGKSGTK